MAGVSTPPVVSVQISSSMTSFTAEKRLERGETISTLKVFFSVRETVELLLSCVSSAL